MDVPPDPKTDLAASLRLLRPHSPRSQDPGLRQTDVVVVADDDVMTDEEMLASARSTR